MDKEYFNELLSNAKLTKKEFAGLVGTSQGSMTNWGTSGRGVPYWVESWLTLYIDNKECKELKQLLRDTVCKDNA